jgi:carbon storage regulator CsrA
MLVLSRHVQEQIHIGDDVIVTVVRIAGNVVRLGITAPREMNVVRGELLTESQKNEAVERKH